MQVRKDTLFYSFRKVRAGLDEEDDEDIQFLVQEQKACRIQAQRFALETNRRRKALEDKRRQWDLHEQTLRENILQQRKQRQQEATERFQRAHLPPSQRRRPGLSFVDYNKLESDLFPSPVSTTRVPNLDEALSHIQGTQTSDGPQSSFLSGTSTISRSCMPSPQTQGGARGRLSGRAVSAAQAFTKHLQERGLGEIKTNQHFIINQLQYNLPKHEGKSQTQEQSDTQISQAESLSSLDSLENEVPQHDRKPDNLDPPKVHETRRPTSLQRRLNGSSAPSKHCPSKSFLGKVMSQQDLSSFFSSSPSSPENFESGDEVQSAQMFLKVTDQFDMTGESQKSNVQPTIPIQKQVFVTSIGHTKYQCRTTTQETISTEKSTIATHCKMQTDIDFIPTDYLRMAQQCKSDSDELTKCTKHISEMKTAQKTSRCPYSTSDLNKVPANLENSASQLVEVEKSFQSTKWKSDKDDVLGLAKRTQLESFGKFQTAEHKTLVDQYSENKPSNAILPVSSKMTEEPEKISVDEQIDLKSKKVKFLRGILKKKLTCIEGGDSKFTYTPDHFTFSKQVAIAIRDSLELSQTKGRDPVTNKCVPKKLRWLDEGENKETVTKQLRKQTEAESRLTPPQPSVDQQQGSCHSWYINVSSGVPKNKKTFFVPVDPNSSKQAWSDVGLQKQKQQEPTGSSGSCTTGFSVPQRAHSARTASGTTSYQIQRGTMIRPHSSSQMQHVVRTHGKSLVPRPPPRSKVTEGSPGRAMMYITKRGNNECTQGKACLAEKQMLHKNYPEAQPVAQGSILKTDEGNHLAPVPPSYACMYETVSKDIYNLYQSDGQSGNSGNGFRKGILNRTPTDEEISLLWHGVRSALSSKDGDSRNLRTHTSLLAALPQTHANLSNVTITGDSLFQCVKSVARLGDLPPSNVRSLPRRPIQEKTRIAEFGVRKPSVFYQAPLPITPSKSDQMVHDQGSEAIDSDEQVAVDSAQFKRAAEFLQSQRGLSTLSLEEQKILKSLDRLNHRLQYVQDVAAENTVLTGTVTLDPTSNQSPQPGKRSCTTMRKYHGCSANDLTHPHKRF